MKDRVLTRNEVNKLGEELYPREQSYLKTVKWSNRLCWEVCCNQSPNCNLFQF